MELLAVLIDRHGAGVTGKEICAAMWPDNSDDSKNTNYLYQLFSISATHWNLWVREMFCSRMDTMMVAALIDRLTFRSHVLDMNEDSYRLKATMQSKV